MKKSIVILYSDLCDKWIDILKEGNFNTVGLHFIPSHSSMEKYLAWLDEGGRDMIAKIEAAGINVEHELHAISYLLPRSLFDTHPEYFRQNAEGTRTNDYNLCLASKEALRIIEDRSFELAQKLQQKGHRYYLWSDDSTNSWCHCPRCREILNSDQNIELLSSVLSGLRRYDKEAELSFLAYLGTINPPTRAIPDGIFLEYAPIKRDMFMPLTSQENSIHKNNVETLLRTFPANTAEILEYWLDVSFYTKWGKLPISRVPFNEELVKSDIEYYRSLGVCSIKTFGAFMDEKYLNTYGWEEIVRFGKLFD